jgi:rare lipoprotein A
MWTSLQRLLCACVLSFAVLQGAQAAPKQQNVVGTASWYGLQFEGRPMANGCPFRREDIMTAALAWPLGTVLRVTNLDNGRSVVVQVRDRGPYVGHRVLDLSEAAATQLGFRDDGLAHVWVQVLRVGPLPPCPHKRLRT